MKKENAEVEKMIGILNQHRTNFSVEYFVRHVKVRM